MLTAIFASISLLLVAVIVQMAIVLKDRNDKLEYLYEVIRQENRYAS